MIHVSSGSGWICGKGKEARHIKVGDVIWAPPGTTHWYGAGDSSIRTRFVVGMGKPNGLNKLPTRNTKSEGKIDCRGLSPETRPLGRSSAVCPPNQEQKSTPVNNVNDFSLD